MKKILVCVMALLLLAPAGFCAEKAPAVPITIAATAKVRAVPQELLALLEKVEANRVDILVAGQAIEISQVQLNAAIQQKAKATTEMAANQAAFLALWQKIYGPVEPPVPPTPDPPVPPEPPVPPTPVVQTVQIVCIEETESSNAAFSRVRNSKEIRQWAEKGGHRIFFLDIDAAAKGGPAWRTWADRAAGKDLPYVFISPASGGDPIEECPSPTDVAGFLKMCQTYGGVGSPEPQGVR